MERTDRYVVRMLYASDASLLLLCDRRLMLSAYTMPHCRSPSLCLSLSLKQMGLDGSFLMARRRPEFVQIIDT